ERSRGISDRNAQGVDYLFKKNKIELIKGEASLQSKNSVQVKSEKETAVLEADHIIIATGARPRELPGVQIDRERIITSKEAMTLTTLPKRLVIVGSGAIGMEFAYYYRVFGAEVTILEALDRVLPVEDAEISKLAARSFTRRGVKIETGALASAVVRKGDVVHLDYEADGGKKSLEADVALIAVGVAPNIEHLGLDEAGVKTHKAGVSVNEHMQTGAPSIYAIGDVIGPPWLAHAASEEGGHAVEHIAGKNPSVIDYRKMPGCTYCKPQVASVGYTEEKAQEEGVEYVVGKFSFKANGRALAAGDTDGMVKLLFEKQYGGLIGGHIIGGEATEMIHEIALGMTQEVTAEEIAKTIHAHPTLGESIREAALDALGERIHGA
ncbi:MAG: dihydrolipoyl dehydrogenase, partial [Candidatus Hinthialibacter sp.]